MHDVCRPSAVFHANKDRSTEFVYIKCVKPAKAEEKLQRC
jgi:hypothetical protein